MENRLSKTSINSCALLIIDMQNDFLLPGAPIECSGGLKAIPQIKKLIQCFKEHKRPIIFSQECHRKEKVDFGLELFYEEPEHCLEGTDGVEFVQQLTPADNDFIIKKRRYSVFFATDLDLLLKGLNVDTLILTGVATDVCVRATAQDALQYNYKVIVPPECVAGTSPEAHQAALNNIAYVFGKIIAVDELIVSFNL